MRYCWKADRLAEQKKKKKKAAASDKSLSFTNSQLFDRVWQLSRFHIKWGVVFQTFWTLCCHYIWPSIPWCDQSTVPFSIDVWDLSWSSSKERKLLELIWCFWWHSMKCFNSWLAVSQQLIVLHVKKVFFFSFLRLNVWASPCGIMYAQSLTL